MSLSATKIVYHNLKCSQALRQAVFHMPENQRPKKLKTSFFYDKFYSLKSHAHYFTAIFTYITTWIAAKLGIFSLVTSINLPWLAYPESINSVLYIYYTDMPPHAKPESGKK